MSEHNSRGSRHRHPSRGQGAYLRSLFHTTKDRAKGTGLGLSISLGIVQDYRGELTFESEENQPTRFHLDLPVDNGG